ncbi:MAG: hypothetical protein FJ290_22190 [Planctomycetes bacterium]|nr:hypothetical protein [Planctomycetota bacterium]
MAIPCRPAGWAGLRKPRSTAHCLLSTAHCLLLALAAALPPVAQGGQAALPDGDGGLAGLAADDVKVLGEARDALERLVADEGQDERLRRDAAIGLSRIHEALNDWGRAGQLDWYLAQLSRRQPGPLQAALAEGAQSAAKARQPHFGGVRDFWRAFDALARDKGLGIAGETERVRKQFEAAADHLAKLAWVSPPLRPFEVKLPPLDLRTLKPLPDPDRRK